MKSCTIPSLREGWGLTGMRHDVALRSAPFLERHGQRASSAAANRIAADVSRLDRSATQVYFMATMEAPYAQKSRETVSSDQVFLRNQASEPDES